MHSHKANDWNIVRWCACLLRSLARTRIVSVSHAGAPVTPAHAYGVRASVCWHTMFTSESWSSDSEDSSVPRRLKRHANACKRDLEAFYEANNIPVGERQQWQRPLRATTAAAPAVPLQWFHGKQREKRRQRQRQQQHRQASSSSHADDVLLQERQQEPPAAAPASKRRQHRQASSSSSHSRGKQAPAAPASEQQQPGPAERKRLWRQRKREKQQQQQQQPQQQQEATGQQRQQRPAGAGASRSYKRFAGGGCSISSSTNSRQAQ